MTSVREFWLFQLAPKGLKYTFNQILFKRIETPAVVPKIYAGMRNVNIFTLTHFYRVFLANSTNMLGIVI